MRAIGVASSIPNFQAAVLRCAKSGSLTSLSSFKGQRTASPDRFNTASYDLTVKCIGKSLTTHAVSSGASEEGKSSSLGKKVGVIGFGQMGGALVRGFLNSEIITVDDICASVTTAERQDYLKEIGINNVFGDAVTKGGAAKVAEFAGAYMRTICTGFLIISFNYIKIVLKKMLVDEGMQTQGLHLSCCRCNNCGRQASSDQTSFASSCTGDGA